MVKWFLVVAFVGAGAVTMLPVEYQSIGVQAWGMTIAGLIMAVAADAGIRFYSRVLHADWSGMVDRLGENIARTFFPNLSLMLKEQAHSAVWKDKAVKRFMNANERTSYDLREVAIGISMLGSVLFSTMTLSDFIDGTAYPFSFPSLMTGLLFGISFAVALWKRRYLNLLAQKYHHLIERDFEVIEQNRGRYKYTIVRRRESAIAS